CICNKRRTHPFYRGRFFKSLPQGIPGGIIHAEYSTGKINLRTFLPLLELRLCSVTTWTICATSSRKPFSCYERLQRSFPTRFYSSAAARTASCFPISQARLSGLRRYLSGSCISIPVTIFLKQLSSA